MASFELNGLICKIELHSNKNNSLNGILIPTKVVQNILVSCKIWSLDQKKGFIKNHPSCLAQFDETS